MKKIFAIAILISSFGHMHAQTNNYVLFDDDWLFYRGAAQGAEAINFDDKDWRKTDLPHDWSIENIPYTNSPFAKNATGQASTGFTENGIGWYRKLFTVPSSYNNKKIYIQFDGVYMNCKVWLNGKSLGRHPYGYTSFYFDITDKLRKDTVNILAVEVKNEGENSRWYAGSGIYRHVWLRAVEPVHIDNWGTYITTANATGKSATVNIITSIKNASSNNNAVKLVTNIIDSSGKQVAVVTTSQNISGDSVSAISQSAQINEPALWSADHPSLYKALTEVFVDDKKTDTYITSFGIRTISFSADKGFLLNGVSTKLKGGCIHHDNGPLGAKAYDDAEIRKIKLLKDAGYNAIRSAHNPPSPALLNACDSLGMLVIDEAFDTWNDPKNPLDYNLYFNDWWQRDIKSMIERDRNHPSVIMWSIGNEIPHREKPEVAVVAKKLSAYVKQLDNTRPVTAGVNGIDKDKDDFISALDVAGYNYAVDKYESDHKRLPSRIMFASESFPLDAFDYWMAVKDNNYVIGDFVWTAYDYIGEASIGWLGYPQTQAFYPWNLAYCGDINICGWKRPQSYYRDALWKENQVSIFVEPPTASFPANKNKAGWSRWEWNDVVARWNWKGYENKPLNVVVYSSCDEVELFLNNKSLGRKKTTRAEKYLAIFSVPYTTGELKAIGYTNNKKVNESILKTAGNVTGLNITADRQVVRANNQDLIYINIEAIDKNGTINPEANMPLTFNVSGAGTIAGVGNADPTSVESNQSNKRKTWRGKCLLIVKSGKQKGEIHITATSGNIKSRELIIKVD
ncbi:glycoside hydrolase family 2 TIM barrel-domain containing protein [Parafilimonas terrae]|uniref:Beta-galactosidase n=1 Tax=Parafilimonas terrae TaxID=1465490 RepID=A0A1I5TN04_9BACT|nr:glycoside hydrolase family 2 TIM barrel-domain containing protein [Parafilimonas terrae]SFP84261.1 beta-galactosidase [Parafilimonas terrae]